MYFNWRRNRKFQCKKQNYHKSQLTGPNPSESIDASKAAGEQRRAMPKSFAVTMSPINKIQMLIKGKPTAHPYAPICADLTYTEGRGTHA